jgi:oligopeptide/dipeptide ABC transporter ATP-binding protein
VALLEVKNLSKSFSISKDGGWGLRAKELLRVVRGVDLSIDKAEILVLVGESGCGKSTLARLITRLTEPDSGEINFEGEDFLHLHGSKLLNKRKSLQMVFQNPFSSLDPRFKIFDSIAEPLRINKEKNIKERVFELMQLVELDAEFASKYPHQCSGGQNQRVCIARAIACNPKLIIADEAVSALDVSIQWTILNLMLKLKRELGISFLFITHDLAVAKFIADRVAVMYLGKIVEIAAKDDLFHNPLHPYTKALLSSAPVPDPTKRDRERTFLYGEIPSASKIPSGCAFRTRCPECFEACEIDDPQLLEDREDDENAEIEVREQCDSGRVAERTSSRLRSTNDRSVLAVHEDHECEENAGIGVPLHAHKVSCLLYQGEFK